MAAEKNRYQITVEVVETRTYIREADNADDALVEWYEGELVSTRTDEINVGDPVLITE